MGKVAFAGNIWSYGQSYGQGVKWAREHLDRGSYGQGVIWAGGHVGRAD